MKTISIPILRVVIISALAASLFFALTEFAHAQAFTWSGSDVALRGWAWSSNIGWISVNCTTGSQTGTNICSSSNYGLSIDNASGAITGYAWSSNIGWVRFGNVSGCPSSNCNARIVADGSNIELRGWAQVCSVYASGCGGAFAPDAKRGGWDGWISLSCENTGVCASSNYQPVLGNDRIQGTAYAWGSFVVGWVDLSGIRFTAPCSADVTKSCDGTGPGSELVTVTRDAWCRETETRETCTYGCDDGPPAQCIADLPPSVARFEPDTTVVRVGDTVNVEIEVTNVNSSCVVITIEGDHTLTPDATGTINETWTSPSLNGATTFSLECDGVATGEEFTVQVIPISTEI